MTAGNDPAAAGRTFHLTPESVWLAQSEAAVYQPEAFAAEGFIHCTDGEENLIAVANAFYRGDRRPYLALVIDLARVAAPVRYDDPERIYPHVHGLLNRDAVVEVRRVTRGGDGAFLGFA